MANLNIHISEKAKAFAAMEAAKNGLADAAAFAATLLEDAADKNGHGEPSTRFHDVGTDLDALIQSQGVRPIEDLSELTADFWPEDESAADVLTVLREWTRSSSLDGPK